MSQTNIHDMTKGKIIQPLIGFTIPLVLAEKADTELKDQSVFVNPYWDKKRKSGTEPEPENALPKELQVPVLEKTDAGEPDDDILDLLKYCEDKLNS